MSIAPGIHNPQITNPSIASSTAESTEGEDANRILQIAVKHRNEDLLEDLLFDVSSPKSAKYGQHLSLNRICEKFSPEPNHVDDVLQVQWPLLHSVTACNAHQQTSCTRIVRLQQIRRVMHIVLQWASLHGAVDIQRSKCSEYVTVRFPEKQLAKAFAGTPGLLCHESSGGCNMAAAVPPSLRHAVDFIDGLGGRANYMADKDMVSLAFSIIVLGLKEAGTPCVCMLV